MSRASEIYSEKDFKDFEISFISNYSIKYNTE